MSIIVETATVYRVPNAHGTPNGRRFLSKRAACLAQAKLEIFQENNEPVWCVCEDDTGHRCARHSSRYDAEIKQRAKELLNNV